MIATTLKSAGLTSPPRLLPGSCDRLTESCPGSDESLMPPGTMRRCSVPRGLEGQPAGGVLRRRRAAPVERFDLAPSIIQLSVFAFRSLSSSAETGRCSPDRILLHVIFSRRAPKRRRRRSDSSQTPVEQLHTLQVYHYRECVIEKTIRLSGTCGQHDSTDGETLQPEPFACGSVVRNRVI